MSTPNVHLFTVAVVMLVVLAVEGNLVTTITEPAAPKRCVLERVYKMLGFNCVKMDLKDIPQNLKSNVEVLDVSFNRIRVLNAQSFQRYTNIKLLYLSENMIQTIAADTFTGLTKLEALDLSYNALMSPPIEIFQLPLLRNIYLSNNALLQLHNDLERVPKPIQAPLQVIHLSECELNRVPNFGILPELVFLNISRNPLKQISVQNFSPYCHLKKVDLNETEMMPCACQAITLHLKQRAINIPYGPLSCFADVTDEFHRCSDVAGASVETEEFAQCNSIKISTRQNKEATYKWLVVALSLGGFLVIFIACLYCFSQHNIRQAKRHRLKQAAIIKKNKSTNGGEILLTNQLP